MDIKTPKIITLNSSFSYAFPIVYFILYFSVPSAGLQTMEGRKVVGLAARDKSGFLSPYSFNLRSLFLSYFQNYENHVDKSLFI